MMATLGRLLARRSVAWAVVLITVALTALFARYAFRVDQDDDLLAFLPKGNREVEQFYEINKSFGGLDVAIVGIEEADPLAPAFLDKLDKLTRRLNDEPSIGHALSITNVEDFTADPERGGVRAHYLVKPFPKTEADKAAMLERVLAKEHIAGHLLSRDGKAVILYNFLAPGADPRTTADLIRRAVKEALPDHVTYWGGAPFISTYIYDTTLADMAKLIPWAVAVIVLIIVASFRDLVGAMLALVSTTMGIVVARGAMGMAGVDASIVLGSMPVILFAVGSAYSIHILVRYYALRNDLDCPDALVETMRQVGPTVTAAGLTTVAGLLSFVAMDIVPMREFGLFTALGILATLVLALTFVPAVVRLVELKGRSFGEGMLRNQLVRLVELAFAKRRPLLLVLGVATVLGATLVHRVEARMESAAFFSSDSPPARAEAFLSEHFGGSQFVQVQIEGDMNDPGVLRLVQRVADTIAVEDHVSSATHVGQILAIVNEAMVGERRIPATTPQVRLLYRFLAGRAALRQLLSEDRSRALIQVKIDTDSVDAMEPLLARIDAIAKELVIPRYRVVGRKPAAAVAEDQAKDAEEGGDEDGEVEPAAAPPPVAEADRPALVSQARALVAAEIAVQFHRAGFTMDPNRRAKLEQLLSVSEEAADPSRVETRLVTFLRSDESLLEPKDHPLAPLLAKAAVALGPKPSSDALEQALATALGASVELPAECSEPLEDAAERPDSCSALDEQRKERVALSGDVELSMATPLAEAWRQERAAARATVLFSTLGVKARSDRERDKLVAGVADALLDIDLRSALLPVRDGAQSDGQLAVAINGQPVLYRGMSKSVTANQFKSLAMAFGLVLLIMMVLFRSPISGALASAPTAFTLIVIYGIMGALGLHLDIGTSMLASIIIGAGVDYAVHLLAAWRADEGDSLLDAAHAAASRAGPAIWTNALMVAAGFFVLTLGDARPLRNVGGLTATAMLTAALATFVIIPALARKKRYGR